MHQLILGKKKISVKPIATEDTSLGISDLWKEGLVFYVSFKLWCPPMDQVIFQDVLIFVVLVDRTFKYMISFWIN